MFAKHGLDVKLVPFTTDADLDAALAANKIQAGNIATHTAIKLIQNNKTDMKLILFMDQSMPAADAGSAVISGAVDVVI